MAGASPAPAPQALDATGAKPRASIVLPTYNRCESLRRCLRGLFECDVEGVEVDLQIVDDGSPDATPELVAQVLREYQGPIRVCYHRQANQGGSAARNRGIAASEAEVVLFIDDDCVPGRQWIRALVEGPWARGTAAVAGRVLNARQASKTARYFQHINWIAFPTPERHFTPEGELIHAGTLNCAYRRQVLEQLGGFEPEFRDGGEDRDLADRARNLGYRLEYCAEAVVEHYFEEDPRVLVRRFWSRACRMYLRQVITGALPKPTWREFAGQTARVVAVGARLLALPEAVWKLRRQGVAARDAVPFALFGWLDRSARRAGQAAMMLRILTGRQTVRRSTPGE